MTVLSLISMLQFGCGYIVNSYQGVAMQLLRGSDCIESIRLQACCEWLSGRCYEVAKFDCLTV